MTQFIRSLVPFTIVALVALSLASAPAIAAATNVTGNATVISAAATTQECRTTECDIPERSERAHDHLWFFGVQLFNTFVGSVLNGAQLWLIFRPKNKKTVRTHALKLIGALSVADGT